MIFLTLGTQLPFDRLTKYLDEITPLINRKVFGQIGDANYRPENYEWVSFLSGEKIQEAYKNCDVIVGHAGMGTILSAAKYKKPLIIVPRLLKFDEHRNDHQVATARQMKGTPGIYIAQSKDELKSILELDGLNAVTLGNSKNSDFLKSNLNNFIWGK